METVRLRLVFDHILSKSQKTDGLKRCWILLKPQHHTISDLSSYLLHAFNLQDECPTGLLLSMEGFALPPFESTSILKDKDIIQVEKNGGVSSEILMVVDKENPLEVVEIVDTQPVAAGMNLLANEEFEKESGGYQSEEEVEEDAQEQAEDAAPVESAPEEKKVPKKRKASKELKSSKRKKSKSASSERSADVMEDIGHDVHGEQNGTLTPSKVNAKRLCQAQEDSNWNVDSLASEAKKLPSRSARRKKMKRRWLREKLKFERNELQRRQLLGKSDQQSSEENKQRVSRESAEKGNQEVSKDVPEKVSGKLLEDQQLPDQDSDGEEDVVPVVIRPGHIRFEPLGKVSTDQAVKQSQTHLEKFQWNGITNKKKGQKWGKEKATSYKMNDYKNVNQERSKVLNIGVRHASDCIVFEKLEFYTSLPKEGDVIAYHLIELSSSWTPELSSYRVGKISRYDINSNRVQLLQVPGYPILPDKEMDDDISALPSETPPYAKDGSIWIEFSQLIEVRLVKEGKPKSAKSAAGGVDEVWIGDLDTGAHSSVNNGNETDACTQENGKVNPWEEINQILSAKKEQLAQEDNWNKAESSDRKPWSCKGLERQRTGSNYGHTRSTK